MHIFDNAHKKLFEIILCLKYDNHVLFATSNTIKSHDIKATNVQKLCLHVLIDYIHKCITENKKSKYLIQLTMNHKYTKD